MKPSTTPTKLSPVANTSKPKKTSKDREKRKSQSLSDSNSQNSENSSPSKDTSACKYAGLGVESLILYNEQCTFEHLTEEVCTAFTEDLNYKLRQIVHEALIKARLSGRNCITSEDVDDVFECLNLERVYGAPTMPNWITFGDNNYMYLDDNKINLIQISEEECTVVQPGDAIMTTKWLSDSSGLTEAQKKYYTTLCYAVIDNRKGVRLAALKDIKGNTKIGPFCEWFYRFGYSLLSKDITYNSLTLYALDLIEALESNPIVPQSITEVQILELLVRLILQRLIQPTVAKEVLKPMCRVLAILCNRLPLYSLVKSKIKQKFHRIKVDFALQIMHIINTFGMDTLTDIFLPNVSYFLSRAENPNEGELISEILGSYNILCCEKENSQEIDTMFFETLGESIMPCWRPHHFPSTDFEKPEIRWLTVKKQLIKSRRYVKIAREFPKRRHHFIDVFPETDEEIKREIFEFEMHDAIVEQRLQCVEPKIKFKFYSFNPAVGRARFLKAAYLIEPGRSKERKVTIGRIHLLAPVLKKSKNSPEIQKCFNHSICNYIV